MQKESLPQELDLFNAVHKLRLELLDWSEDKEAQVLALNLKEYLKRVQGPRSRERAITLALNKINTYEPARVILEKYISVHKAELDFKIEGYEPLPGEKQTIEPGPLMVCPKRGCLYKQYFLFKGDTYVCPLHNLELKPANSNWKKR
ncbi:MAG: hypothetical protein CVU44_10575 [Chloroflexi bacterium HGW-Chloroflexi-6]|nr:MAG: hypothetical protein CVU44_10575 [Chloroflexi bacterium HGW-Chloroflexi-6]